MNSRLAQDGTEAYQDGEKTCYLRPRFLDPGIKALTYRWVVCRDEAPDGLFRQEGYGLEGSDLEGFAAADVGAG